MKIKEGATSKDFLKGNTARREEYTVWFEQVNANYFTVRARTPLEAAREAIKLWRAQNAHPVPSRIEDESGKVHEVEL